jgi:hypothetical protein
VKNRFQSLPFKFNLQRYNAVEMSVHCDVVVFSWLLDYVKSSIGAAIARWGCTIRIQLTHNF